MEQMSRNPATAVELRTYIRANAALDREFNARMQRLQEQYHTREAQLIEEHRARIQESRAGLEAAEQELDTEFDTRQLQLDRQLRSALNFAQQPEGGFDHPPPRESFGTRTRDNHGQSRGIHSEPTAQQRISSGSPAQVLTPRVPGSEQSSIPTLVASDLDTRNDQGQVIGGNLHDIFLHPPPMDTYNMETEYDRDTGTIFDAFPRPALPPAAVGDSPIGFAPAHTLYHEADETFDAAHATILPVDDARDGPDSQILLSPDSGYGSLSASCTCGQICPKGQPVCDSCAAVFDSVPFP